MAKRSFDTVRLRLNQNLRCGIFVTSKNACDRRENSRGIKVLSVYILNDRIVHTGLSPSPLPPPTPPLILYWSFQDGVSVVGNSNWYSSSFYSFPDWCLR